VPVEWSNIQYNAGKHEGEAQSNLSIDFSTVLQIIVLVESASFAGKHFIF
jgi:hypothetical protein